MLDYIKAVNATMLVLGSENLAKDSSQTIGSFCLSAVKSFHEIPVLIVKVNSVGECHMSRLASVRSDFRNERKETGMKCMLEVRPNSVPLTQWILGRLNSSVDKVYLAKARAIDIADNENPAASRMLSAFQDKAATFGFSTIPRRLKGDPIRSL